MCGFAGYYGAGDFNREEVIDQMGERIAHRGPDSKGSFVDDYVALGFRRLSIIDLEGGSQPIHSADGKHVIIFNGEIYNYQEIRKELIEKHGCQFQTNSDTEVILQGYKTYGEKIASMLRGMFAFVIYDKETHNLFGDPLLVPMKEIVKKEVYTRDSAKNTEIVIAQLGNDAGIIGAAFLGNAHD